MKVLVAKINPVAQRKLEHSLRDWGHDVISVSTGIEALKVLHTPNAPRVAILGWRLTNIDGLEIVRRLRKFRADRYVYVLFLTKKVGKENLLEAMDAGADDYLVQPVDLRELKARLLGAQRIINMQNELVSARDIMKEQATHDALTGLWNRAAIFEILENEIIRTKREDTSMAVLMVDLDHFKQVNDTHGHKAGDIVLEETTRRMRTIMRPYDFVGRYGGEEFLIIVPRCDPTFAGYVAQRVRAAIADKPFEVMGHSLNITISIGFASARAVDDLNGDGLIQAADCALYRAKDKGRNCVVSAEGCSKLLSAEPTEINT